MSKPITGFGSHQPALRALAKFTRIESVIEFGAGTFSTHFFLDREVYPDLTSLVTLEHDKVWADKMRTDDKRHRLIVCLAETRRGCFISHGFVDASAGMKADFVFLDSGPDMETRVSLIDHAMTLAPIVAIHDMKEKAVTQDVKYMRGFNSIIQTVFMSNSVDLAGLEIEYGYDDTIPG
jgi:hypothetical protein